MKKIILILLSFFTISSSFGQQYYSRNYDINSGLPSNTIYDIYKDSRGFLWLGTDAGLVKFDGKSFTVFTTQNGLCGNKIITITESADGNIWAGSYQRGISQFDGKEIKTYTTESGLISNRIQKLHYSAKNNVLLIGTTNGLSVYRHGKFKSYHQKLNNVNRRLQVTSFFEVQNYIYVFTSDNELYRYQFIDQTLERVPANHPLNLNQSYAIFISSKGDTLAGSKRNFLRVLRSKGKNIKINIGKVTDFKQDLDQNVWIAAWDNNYMNAGGLYKLDSAGITDFSNYLDINTRNILALEFDPKENLLWIGTKENGLFLYPQINFSYRQADDFNLKELGITDLCIDNQNKLWAATRNNIVEIYSKDSFELYPFKLFNKKFNDFVNTKTHKKYSYLIDEYGSHSKYQELIETGQYGFSNPYKNLNNPIIPEKQLYKPLKHNVLVHKKLIELNSVLKDTAGNIWVGSNVGIFKLDKITQEIFFFDLEGHQFRKFHFDQNNRLFALTWSEVFIYPDIEKNNEHYYYDYYEHKSPINVTSIRANNDDIWFASSDHGLFLYRNNKFHSTMNSQTVKNKSFNDLCVDRNGNIIAAGNDGVIYVVNFKNNTINTKLTIANKSKQFGTNIRYLNCDINNRLIVGTHTGLNIIDLAKVYQTGSLSIENIDKSKGFTDYSGKISILQNNRYLWIGSNKNLIKLDINELHNETPVFFNFYIKSISINDEKLDADKLESNPWTNIPTSSIKLPYHRNSIAINFDIIKYLDPQNIEYNYKLEGYHKNWVNKVKEGKAVFQNLKPGNYLFRLRVVNNGDSVSKQELSLNFKVLAPLWQKWWVITLFVFSVIVLIRTLVVLRTNSIKKKERLRREISERVTEFELKALRAQMNPHFIFNAINSIQNYMLDNDVDAALGYLSDFAKLIRLTLDNVTKKKISLSEELEYLKYYISLEQMRFDKNFDLEVILSSEIENNKILIPSMILQPYIENSIKHGFIYKESGGKIRLEFTLNVDNILKCTIEDNGVGRKKSRELNKSKKKHTSKGTFITTERLALLNQTQTKKGYKVETIDLYDEFNLACGIRVEISIPI